jgi:hypothetical protein
MKGNLRAVGFNELLGGAASDHSTLYIISPPLQHTINGKLSSAMH